MEEKITILQKAIFLFFFWHKNRLKENKRLKLLENANPKMYGTRDTQQIPNFLSKSLTSNGQYSTYTLYNRRAGQIPDDVKVRVEFYHPDSCDSALVPSHPSKNQSRQSDPPGIPRD